MRRVVSYGGTSGVPASQRLKLKLSLTAGMHLLTNDVKQEQQGFLAPVVEQEHERIIHRTSGVTRNLSSIESFKGFGNRSRDSFTFVESTTIENVERSATLLVATEIKDDKEQAGSSTAIDLVVGGLRQNDGAGGNPALNKHDPSGSYSDLGEGASITTSSVDSTIKQACVNPADSREGAVVSTQVSHAESSRLNIIKNGNSLRERVLRSDGTHVPEASFSCASERLQEGCQSESSCQSDEVDRNHTQDLKLEIRFYNLASPSTSSVVPGGDEDTRTLRGDSDGGDICEHDQAKDNDEDKVVQEPSIPSGDSGPDGFRGDLLLERNKDEDSAALMIQGCWKRWLGRRQYRLLKEEVAAMTRKSREENNAAIVVQTSWRSAQSRLLLKHLKMEMTVRTRAATVIQAHTRAYWSRRELKRLTRAVLTIQMCWRRFLSSRDALETVASSLQQSEERRLHAAIILQAYVRGYVVRQKLVRTHKAAVTIQRQWKAYSYMCTEAATKLQAYVRAFLVRRKYAIHKKTMVEESAAVLIQACVRGHLVRCHLTILHTAALIIQLQWRRYSRECQFQAVAAGPGAARGADPKVERPAYHHHADLLLQSGRDFVGFGNDVQMECLDELDLSSGEDLVGRFKEDPAEFWSEVSSIEKVVDTEVHREIDECKKTGVEGYGIAVSLKGTDSGLRRLLNGELPPVPTGELPVGKASQNEDWNNVSVDHLDECLDTCLASLRPLPSDISASVIAAEQCFPKFVILEEAHSSQQPSSSYQSTGYLSVDGRERMKVALPSDSQATTITRSTPRLQRAPSRKGVKHDVSRNVSSVSSESHLNQTTLSSGDSLQSAHGSASKDSQSRIVNQAEEADQGGGKAQGRSRRAESLKRNEERLQQFAQVFLLQRHIAFQQQRAQSAPPFPPSALAGSGSVQESRLNSTRPISANSGTSEGDAEPLAVHQVQCHASASEVTLRHTKYDLDRGNVHCSDTPSIFRQTLLSNQSGEASSVKEPRQTPGTDVVVDMVLLLRKIEEVYGTSDVDFGEANNSCFTTRRGDIEEGGPVVDRRKRPPSVAFTKSLSMTHIGLPNVNAMLLVIIAMVVYTKTICQSVIFGTKQTHRKI